MISNQLLLEAIQAKGYRYKRENDRSIIYKKQGGVDRITMRKNAVHRKEAAISILGDAGYSRAEIRELLAKWNAH